ncbi:unnamed protein product [Symbiodinium microadriaticum]|nr:unnamed protein product [Symbiodinium microadriaticum]
MMPLLHDWLMVMLVMVLMMVSLSSAAHELLIPDAGGRRHDGVEDDGTDCTTEPGKVFLRPRCDWVRGFTCLAWPWKWSGCHEVRCRRAGQCRRVPAQQGRSRRRLGATEAGLSEDDK